ncbi:high-affinity iron permease [Sporothrix bragantina]|uniref:High-affinity iron permease n=1 Tax=Sporothrix bragantina TaxID=671064 RepID=A0ABP0CV37_9PEZI
MALNVFSVAVFLVVFRESIEAGIVVTVMLAFLKKSLGGSPDTAAAYKALVKQVWLGAGLGFVLCLIVGGAVIGTFYRLGKNVWQSAEYYYEGAFYLVAALIITFVGAAMLRVSRMQENWQIKIAKALEEPKGERQGSLRRSWLRRIGGKYMVFALSFFTVAREGIEGIVFIAGVTFSAPSSSVPLPVVVGLICGFIVGFLLYKGGSVVAIHIFLIASTALLYLVAAGLVARSISYFEQAHWNARVGADASEAGSGPGSYDISHFEGGYGWGIFNGIFGWTNTATYSSVITYNVYWISVIDASTGHSATSLAARTPCWTAQAVRRRHDHLIKAESSLLTQVRTGYVGLRAYLFKQHAVDSPTCTCGAEDETPAHVLLSCTTAPRRPADWPQTLTDLDRRL